MRIYVASSWRNERYPTVVEGLKNRGHEVFDFRHPVEGNAGFHWSEIDPEWKTWEPDAYVFQGLEHPLAVTGFSLDFAAMCRAEACVLVLPSGRSAHLEAGYFVGRGRPLHILVEQQQEPELMYRMATRVWTKLESMLGAFDLG